MSFLFCSVYFIFFFNYVTREQSSDISETGVSENDENPVRIISVTPAKTEPVKNKVCQGIFMNCICIISLASGVYLLHLAAVLTYKTYNCMKFNKGKCEVVCLGTAVQFRQQYNTVGSACLRCNLAEKHMVPFLVALSPK